MIHTFGVGDDCDRSFCERLAEAGEGVCEIVTTKEVQSLRAKVIETLSKTLQPSLKEVKTAIKGAGAVVCRAKNMQNKESEIYRNQLYSEFFIIQAKDFEKSEDLEYNISYVDS